MYSCGTHPTGEIQCNSSSQVCSYSFLVNIFPSPQRHTIGLIYSTIDLLPIVELYINGILQFVQCVEFMQHVYPLLVLFSILIKEIWKSKYENFFKLTITLLNYRTQPSVKIKILVNFINHFLKKLHIVILYFVIYKFFYLHVGLRSGICVSE